MKPVQKYRNEYRAQKRRKFVLKTSAVLFILVLIAVGTVYLLFFSKLLDVRTVAINGAETIEETDLNSAVGDWLSTKIWKVPRRNNLVFLSADNLVKYLESKFPKLASVSVSKKLPHNLEITVSERKPIGVWCLSVQGQSSPDCFYFDKDAVAYAMAGNSSGFLLATISDQRNREITLGSLVTTGQWFENILSARDLLTKIGIDITGISIPAGSFDEFDAKTIDGWQIMFSNQTDISSQINSLAIFLKDKITPNQRAKLQYVDLRIQDRIYFK